jgi:hypothetical protein
LYFEPFLFTITADASKPVTWIDQPAEEDFMKRWIMMLVLIGCLSTAGGAWGGPMSDAFCKAAGRCDMETLNALIEAGVDLDEFGAPPKSKPDRAPLYWAVGDGCAEGVAALLAAGAEVDPVDKFGRTPLWEAADEDELEVAKMLLDYGANPNRADRDDVTPLANAAAHGHAEMVTLLVSAGPPQAGGWDRLTTTAGDVVHGRVATESFKVNTVFGAICLKPKLIRAIHWHPDEDGPSYVVLHNGDRLVGPISPDRVVMQSQGGQDLETSADQIEVIHFWPK